MAPPKREYTKLEYEPDSEEEREKQNPTRCVDDNYYVYEFDDQWATPNICNRNTCNRDGTITEEKCPELKVPEGCKVSRGMGTIAEDYPFCCDRVVCPGDDEYRTGDEDWTQFCYDKNCIRELDEQWTDRGYCNLRTCKRDFEIHEETCPELEVPEGCKLTEEDLKEKFPGCCPKVVCPAGVGAADLTSETNQENAEEDSQKAKDTANVRNNLKDQEEKENIVKQEDKQNIVKQVDKENIVKQVDKENMVKQVDKENTVKQEDKANISKNINDNKKLIEKQNYKELAIPENGPNRKVGESSKNTKEIAANPKRERTRHGAKNKRESRKSKKNPPKNFKWFGDSNINVSEVITKFDK